MGRRCVLTAGKAERAELERLSRSAVRGEADRARAVLWSLAGETSAAIAARLGVRAEQVRRWRAAVRSGGVAAAKALLVEGRSLSAAAQVTGVPRSTLADALRRAGT